MNIDGSKVDKADPNNESTNHGLAMEIIHSKG